MKAHWVKPEDIIGTDQAELDQFYERMYKEREYELLRGRVESLKRQVAQYEELLKRLPKTFPNENRPDA